MLCPLLSGNLLKLRIRSPAGSGELRDPGGKNCDHEAARAEVVERVDLGFDVATDEPIRPSAIVEPTSEKEHRIGCIDLRNGPALQVPDKAFDLVLHAEAERPTAGKGATRAFTG